MNKKAIVLWAWGSVLLLLAACSPSSETAASTSQQTQSSLVNANVAAVPASNSSSQTAVINSATQSAVATAVITDSATHEAAITGLSRENAPVQITLQGEAITVAGEGVTADGRQATITAAGTYYLTGSLVDGQIVVNTADKETVHLILDGVDISNSTGAAINIIKAEEVVIILADNSKNSLTDGAAYVFANPEEDEPNAALFSKADLTIYGNGALTVNGNYNDGIASKDGLVIGGGTIVVTAVDDGIRGKDYLIVQAGTITVNAQGDGLKADNEEDATRGYIAIESGTIQVTAVGDAIQAASNVLITGGDFALTSGGGSAGYVDADTSAKGIKGAVSVIIDGGIFTINAADDAIHANDSLVINGGAFTIATGDDGIHADATLTVNDGLINITQSYEGIESAVITINGGDITIVSSDDGLNVAGGNDGSGTMAGPGGRPGGGPRQDAFTYTGNYFLYINGGTIVIDAAGDGIDVNGAIEMTGGTVIVNGPTMQMNGALDYDGYFNISGGLLVAVGSAGMAQAPGTGSTQYSLLLNFNGTLTAGTLIHIQTRDGAEILTFAPTKATQSITFSSPDLASGVTYDVYAGGSAIGNVEDGLYLDASYTPGNLYTSFTISSIVTAIGNRMR
ncbi:MAG TPA: carbohydrate-binding domain-containing protein [Chloroflexota bacterium]|nr:carbohydrate-binding domain-containing protein [Chloroflexota bacterium]